MNKLIQVSFVGCLLAYNLMSTVVFASAPVSLSELMKLSSHGFQSEVNSGDLSFEIPTGSKGQCIGLSFQFFPAYSSSIGCAPNNTVKQQVLKSVCVTEDEEGNTYYIWPSDFYNLLTEARAPTSDQCLYVADANDSTNNAAFSLDNCTGGSCDFNRGANADFATLGLGVACTVDSDCNASPTYADSFEFLTLTLASSTSILNDGSQNFKVILDSSNDDYINMYTINAYQAFSQSGDNESLASGTSAYYLSSSEGSQKDDPSSFVFYESTDNSGMNFVPMDVESGISFDFRNESSNLFSLGTLENLEYIKFVELTTMSGGVPLDTSDYDFYLNMGESNFSITTPSEAHSAGIVESFSQSISPASDSYSLTTNSTNSADYPGTWILYASIDGINYFPISTQLTNATWTSDLNLKNINLSKNISAPNLGTPLASSTGAYTVNFPPVISGLSVTTGPAAGGNEISISGKFLGSVNSVTFGGNAAAIVSTSPNNVVVQVPAGNPGDTVDLAVASPAGAATTDSAAYTYNMPT